MALRRHYHGEETDAALEVHPLADDRGGYMPPVAVLVTERIAMAGTRHPAAGFDADGRIIGMGKRPQRVVAGVEAVSVGIVFRAGSGILKKVFCSVFEDAGA